MFMFTLLCGASKGFMKAFQGFDSLFTYIPLDIFIAIYVNKLFRNPEILFNGMSKNDFRDLLNFATKESYFTLVYGVTMRSLLGPILACIFL